MLRWRPGALMCRNRPALRGSSVGYISHGLRLASFNVNRLGTRAATIEVVSYAKSIYMHPRLTRQGAPRTQAPRGCVGLVPLTLGNLRFLLVSVLLRSACNTRGNIKKGARLAAAHAGSRATLRSSLARAKSLTRLAAFAVKDGKR